MLSEEDTAKKNPFQYGKPVRDPKNFFGREEEIKSMYDQILSLNSISLIGERKIGKTSLLLHLVHPQTLTKYGITEDILMFYIDISTYSLSKPSDVFRKFLECISEKITGKIKEEANTLLKREYIPFQQFAEIIAKINNNSQKIAFFLDEFENISMVKQGDVFSRLRYLAQMYDVVFVISTLRDLRSLFREARFSTSPFFNIFTTYQLRGLEESASRELIIETFKHGGQKVERSEIDSLVRFSGTNPFFLKLSSFFYFEAQKKGKTEFDENLKTVIQQKLEPHHQYNWEHLPKDERIALLDIVKNGNSENSFAERSLERKGYIKKEGDILCITSGSFQRYIEAILASRPPSLDVFKNQIAEIDAQYLTESDKIALEESLSRIEEHQLYLDELGTPVFKMIRYFELEMRDYIKKTLEIVLSTDWFKRALDDTSRKEIEKRISKEAKRRMHFRYSDNPLNYALLDNLRDIIIKRENWDLCFSRYFEDKKAFEVKMQEIIDTRNRTAHFHSINYNEAVIVIQNILWMLTRMRKQHWSVNNQHLKERVDAKGEKDVKRTS